MLQSFSLLFLGATLSTLATINFSLSLVIGLICAPLNFIRPLPHLPSRASLKTADDMHSFLENFAVCLPATALFIGVAPPVVGWGVNMYFANEVLWTLMEMARGWIAQGVWTSLVLWGVWWPAWVLGGSVMLSGVWREG